MWKTIETRPARALLGLIPLVMLLVLTVQVVSVRAAEAPQFGIRPATNTSTGYFVLKAQPGDILKDTAVVVNSGNVPVKLKAYPVDATTGQTSGAVYLGNSDPRKEVGSWIGFEKTEFELPAKQQVAIPFTVTVPKESRSGQYLGGIAVQPVEQPESAGAAAGGSQSNQAAFGVVTVTRAVTAVLVNVGPAADNVRSMRILKAELKAVTGQPRFSLALQNDGNVLVTPKGEVSVTGADGKLVASAPLNLQILVPGTTINYPVGFDLPQVSGEYKVKAALDYGGKALATYEGTISYTAPAKATPAASAAKPAATGSNATGQAAANAPAATTQAVGQGSTMLLIVAGIAALLLAAVIGMGGYILRTRKRS